MVQFGLRLLQRVQFQFFAGDSMVLGGQTRSCSGATLLATSSPGISQTTKQQVKSNTKWRLRWRSWWRWFQSLKAFPLVVGFQCSSSLSFQCSSPTTSSPASPPLAPSLWWHRHRHKHYPLMPSLLWFDSILLRPSLLPLTFHFSLSASFTPSPYLCLTSFLRDFPPMRLFCSLPLTSRAFGGILSQQGFPEHFII